MSGGERFRPTCEVCGRERVRQCAVEPSGGGVLEGAQALGERLGLAAGRLRTAAALTAGAGSGAGPGATAPRCDGRCRHSAATGARRSPSVKVWVRRTTSAAIWVSRSRRIEFSRSMFQSGPVSRRSSAFSAASAVLVRLERVRRATSSALSASAAAIALAILSPSAGCSDGASGGASPVAARAASSVSASQFRLASRPADCGRRRARFLGPRRLDAPPASSAIRAASPFGAGAVRGRARCRDRAPRRHGARVRRGARCARLRCGRGSLRDSPCADARRQARPVRRRAKLASRSRSAVIVASVALASTAGR